MKQIFLTFIIISSFFSCTYINKKFGLNDDNDFEEITESVIYHKTGLDIDLSPQSQERPVL